MALDPPRPVRISHGYNELNGFNSFNSLYPWLILTGHESKYWSSGAACLVPGTTGAGASRFHWRMGTSVSRGFTGTAAGPGTRGLSGIANQRCGAVEG